MKRFAKLVGQSWKKGIFVYAQLGLSFLAVIVLNKKLASIMGVSDLKDAFDIAFNLPFVIFNLVGLNFLQVVSTTMIKQAATRGRVSESISSLLNLYLIFCAIISLVVYLFFDSIIHFLAPGFNIDQQEIVGNYSQISLLILSLIGLSTALASGLTALGLPTSREFSIFFMRASALLGIEFLPTQNPKTILFLFVLGLVANVLIQVGLLVRIYDFKYIPQTNLLTQDNFQTIRSGGYFSLAATFSTLFFIQINRMASTLGDGTVASLGYALAISQPISILIGKPASLILAPKLILPSGQVSPNAARQFKKNFKLASILIGLTGLFSSLIVFLCMPWIVQLLYFGGKFEARHVTFVSELARYFSFTIPFSVLLWLFLYPLQNYRQGFLSASSYILGSIVGLLINALFFEEYALSCLILSQTLVPIIQAIAASVSYVYWSRNILSKVISE